MTALPALAATGIGSVPFTDPDQAVGRILRHLPEVPFWPQMVRLGYAEEMLPQGAQGLPALEVDLEERRVRLDPRADREMALAHFYETAFSGDLGPFALPPEGSRGFAALVKAVPTAPAISALKGQVVGPVTFAGMVKDAADKPILYDRELTQAVSQGLARAAAWQAQTFRNLGKEAVIFLDEPILTGYGSAFLPISREEVTTLLTDTLDTIRQFGPALLGLHCCGNTDWAMLLELPLDILSFDSYGYFDTLLLYDKALLAFLERGGRLAWGLVPTGEELQQETADSLFRRFEGQVRQLAVLGPAAAQILSQALLTPACGLGYLSPEQAARALALLQELSELARRWRAAA
ncbi:MAG: methionine synthase [Deltaproteobacteria bacterium]|nr:methionine synthase [Deltaproteobacteria bacterium]